MLTPERRHYQERANKRAELRRFKTPWECGWMWQNKPGLGKWYKGQWHRAERRYWRDTLHGRRGKEPTGAYSAVSWRGT